MYKKRTCLQRSKASILTREGALCSLEATNLTNRLGSATHSFVCEHCVWGWLGLVVVAPRVVQESEQATESQGAVFLQCPLLPGFPGWWTVAWKRNQTTAAPKRKDLKLI